MNTIQKDTITIIGAGLGGSFLALLLAQRGYKVEIFEKFSLEEIRDTNSKRSYNITFLAYGVEMLKKANIWETLQPHMHALKGVSTQLSKNSKPIFTPTYDKKNQYFAVSRAGLLTLMHEQLAKNPLVNIHYETALLSIDRHDKYMIVQESKTKKIETVSCDVIIGADGANSLVRPFIQQGQDTIHTQEYSPGGYKQFTISKKQIDKLHLQSGIAYTWSAKDKFILAFPNFDDSLACLLIYPKDNKDLSALTSAIDIKKLIQEDFPILLPIVEDLAEQLTTNPIGNYVTIHTEPWYYKDFMTVIGDGAHGFYPFFGQGTSAAFGDGLTIVTLIDQYGDDWSKIFPLYQKIRKEHMDALGELSKEGLTRYARNRRADYDAIYDKLEMVGNSLLPKYIHPPTLIPVMNDPANTATYVANTKKQRKIAKRLGVSLFVSTVKHLIAIRESLQGNK